MTPTVFGLVGAVAALLVSGSIAWVLVSSRAKLSLDQRIAALRQRMEAAREMPIHRSASAGGPGFSQSARSLGLGALRVVAIFAPVGAKERAKLAEMLAGAGLRPKEALPIFLTAKLGFSAVVGVVVGIQVPHLHPLGENFLVATFAGLIGAVAGGILPEFVMRQVISRRRRALAEGLPQALDLMVLCLESGLTFERSLTMVAQELNSLSPQLAQELNTLEAELRMVEDRRAALHALYERTRVEGLRDFAMAISQGERYGTPLSQTMQNIAHSERIQRRTRIEAQAARLPVIISLPMLLLVVPGTILLVAGPAFLQAMSALGGF